MAQVEILVEAAAAVQSGGQPEFIPLLARAAVAAGVDGIFVEVHDDPPRAKSDGANALDLRHLPALLDQLLAVHSALMPGHQETLQPAIQQ